MPHPRCRSNQRDFLLQTVERSTSLLLGVFSFALASCGAKDFQGEAAPPLSNLKQKLESPEAPHIYIPQCGFPHPENPHSPGVKSTYLWTSFTYSLWASDLVSPLLLYLGCFPFVAGPLEVDNEERCFRCFENTTSLTKMSKGKTTCRGICKCLNLSSKP